MTSNIDFAVITEWIHDKHVNIDCAVCGSNNWEISPRLFTMPELTSGVLQVGQTRQAMFFAVVICRACKQNLFFNAISIMVQNEQNKAEAIEVSSNQDPDIVIN